jgi:hypothetical protein
MEKGRKFPNQTTNQNKFTLLFIAATLAIPIPSRKSDRQMLRNLQPVFAGAIGGGIAAAISRSL